MNNNCMFRKRTIIIFSLKIAHDIQYTLKGKCTEIARTYISVWHNGDSLETQNVNTVHYSQIYKRRNLNIIQNGLK